MSDIMKIWGLGSMWIDGGHRWARVRVAARSRRLLRRSMVRESESGILDQQDYGSAVVILRAIYM
jgi:hypothetical protein